MSFAVLYPLAKLWPVVLPPLGFWLWLRWQTNEDLDPRPFLKFFVAGALACFPIALFERALFDRIGDVDRSIAGTVVESWFIAAIPEELARAGLLAYGIVKRRGFAEPAWIIGAAVALSMGQAALETAFLAYAHPEGPERIGIFLVRAILCVPTMGTYGIAMGVLAAWERCRGGDWRLGLAAGLGLAVLGHGIYDTSLFMVGRLLGEPAATYVSVLIAAIVVTIVFLPVKSRYASIVAAGSPRIDGRRL
jgi:RsiW-degrading membrane proteinase PrsW (M82 family)